MWRSWLWGSVCGLILVHAQAVAQPIDRDLSSRDLSKDWPSKPIKLVVPYQAGSSSDAVARIVGQRLSERLGQPLAIENRVGASGNLGSEAVARAEPDGYTIGLATTSTHAVAPSIGATLRYDPLGDFAPVSMLGSSPLVFVIYPGLPVHNLAQFIAHARARPRALNYATSGPASMGHLAAALLEKLGHLEMTHVPYRGTAQSVVDLIGGRIEIVVATIPPSLQLINEGKIRAIATTGQVRTPALPQIPTIAEGGIAGYECVLWQAIVAPAGTPREIVARLAYETRAVLTEPATKAQLEAQGVDAEPSTPAALTDRIRADIEKWRSVIRAANIGPAAT